MEWTIVINKVNAKIFGAKLKDEIGEGQELVENSIKITDSSGATVNKTITIDGTNNFEIDFGNINESYAIKYKVKITNEKLEKYKNLASLVGSLKEGNGTGEGEVQIIENFNSEGKLIKQNIFKKEQANEKVNNVEYRKIDYKDKTMSWKLTVDGVKEKIYELEINEKFDPEKSMFLVEDSLIIRRNGTDILEKDLYTVTDNGVDGFSIKANVELKKAKYEIYFKTSFDPDKVLSKNGVIGTFTKFKNIANFAGEIKGNIGFKEEKSAEYDIIKFIANGGKKEGTFNKDDRIIKWKVYTNVLDKEFLNKYSIIDEISDGQVLNKDLVVKTYALGKDGNIIDEKIVIEGYEINYIDDKNFSVVFENGVDIPILLEYTTKISGISKDKYTNEANVETENYNRKYKATVSYKDYNKFIDKKSANIEGNDVYQDDEIHWDVVLNESLSDLKNAKFKDTISVGQVYVNGSLKLFDEKGNEIPISENDLIIKNNNVNEETIITLNLGDIDKVRTVKYTTVILATEGKISNEAILSSESLTEDKKIIREYVIEEVVWGGGTGQSKKGSIDLKKIDFDTKEIITENEAKFKLYYILNDEKIVVTGKTEIGTTDENGVVQTVNGKLKFSALPFKKYYLEEIEAPKGYETLGKTIEFEVTKENKNIVQEIENNKNKLQVVGKKIWDGGPDEKPIVEFQLYRNNEKYGDSVFLNSGTTEYTWEKLDKADSHGNEYKYRVDEISLIENYGKEIVDDTTIKNIYESSKIDVIGCKIWENTLGEKPEIELQLYRNGKIFGDKVKLKDGEINYIWRNLDKEDHNGREYVYTVDEVKVPKNYKKEIVDKTRIKNIYEKPVVDIVGNKIWENAPSEKPTIEIQLYRDGKVYGDKVQFKDGKISHTWKDLDKEDLAGKEYIYTIDEVEVPEYYEKYIEKDGLTIKNIYNKPKDSGGHSSGNPPKHSGPTKPSEETEVVDEIKIVDTTEEIPKTDDIKEEDIVHDLDKIPEKDKPSTIFESDIKKDIDDYIPSKNITRKPTSKVKRLPKTGQEENSAYYVVGLSLIILSVFLRRKFKAK